MKAWPIHKTETAIELMTMQSQLEVSQWWAPAQLRAHQFQRLAGLVTHARANVPHYAKSLKKIAANADGILSAESWAKVPILKRSDVRDLGEKLFAKSYPKAFGAAAMAMSGGSTGIPVRVRKTELDSFMWNAIHLRDELWHREFIGGTLANFRGVSNEFFSAQAKQPGVVKFNEGLLLDDWGPPTQLIWNTGKMGVLQPGKSLATQARFLIELRPDYLLMRPAGLRLLLAYLRENDLRLSPLRAVWTLSEQVSESLRDECRAVLGCRIVSNYSASETGYIALQCPTGDHYHIMSEVVHVEVVDGAGKACAPGQIGRVLVTPLYNYAMPLLRYEIGDEAEVGPRCSCGRGLPVLARIVGRLENYLTLRSGERIRVDLSHYRLAAIVAIREFQLAQTGFETIELRLATARPLEPSELQIVDALMRKSFGAQFGYAIVYLDSIPKTASGKLMQFVSELA